ncbi:MAG: hypothetical protein OHK0029_39900 [Armatimonadaceae bacterium]
MFNPSKIKMLIGSTDVGLSSFVGICTTQNGDTVFCIPIGFDSFPLDEPDARIQLFFDLYKTFRKFSELKNNNPNDTVSEKIDGSLAKSDGFTFIDTDNEEVTLFSKIPMLDQVLESFNELKAFSLSRNIQNSENLDYSQIYRYLTKCTYLENDVAYVDSMMLPRSVVSYKITDLISMYCFIYSEIKQALHEQNTLPNEVIFYAEDFKSRHLQNDSALFLSKSHDDTIELLKFILDEIDKQVALKDEDYWFFYEVVENFLYGGGKSNAQGIFWGISKFSLVWEDICLSYLFKHNGLSVLFADSWRFANIRHGNFNVYVKENFSNFFFFFLW